MLLHHLLEDNKNNCQLRLIKQDCSAFLTESMSNPVFKMLPKTYNTFQKVKVRQQKKRTIMGEAFNKAFDHFSNIRQRAVFADSTKKLSTETVEPFYIFPVNGYKFLYSKEVVDSSKDYQLVLNTLSEQLDNNETVVEIIIDLLKYTYSRKMLNEGIQAGSEIIFYSIPYYYAVRVSSFDMYKDLLEKVFFST